MYKIIISIVLWPIWFCFLLFSLIIISLALYIIPKDKLFLVRDRFGEKPLYYGFIGSGTERSLVFASEISAIIKIPFFKKDSLTTTLPAQLALRYKCNIVPIHIMRKTNELFEMEIYKPMDIIKFEDSEKSKIEISLKLNKIIESMITKDPSQWIWTHNRWK